MEAVALLIAATLNAGTVLALAALGLLINEKVGVVNLGAEGLMLCGALAGFAAVVHLGVHPLGFVAGMAVGAALSLLLAACPQGNSLKVRPVGGLLIICEPADAQVFIDDRYHGTVAGLGGRSLTLVEGQRRLELRKEGYFAFFGEVSVVKGVRQKLRVILRKEPF